MVVAEPSTFGGLWPQVRAATGWPEANEDTVVGLAGDWVGAGEKFTAASGFQLPGSWTDDAGKAFADRAKRTLDTAKQAGTDMGKVAQRAIQYAGHVIDAKNYIQRTVNDHIPGFVLAGLLPPGVNSAVQAKVVSQLTADIMTYLRQTADKITKGLPPPPQEPTPDKGAGPHGTEQATPSDVMEALKLRALALGGDLAGLPDAARNLNHFLDNTGEDLVVDPDRIANDVPTFKQNTEAQAQAEINKVAHDAAARGEYGKPVPFTTGWDGTYLTKEQSENWYYAVGGIQHSATGTVTVYPPDTPGGPPRVEAQYQTHVWDRYNWDHGKGVEIGGVPVLDDNQGRSTAPASRRSTTSPAVRAFGTTEARSTDQALQRNSSSTLAATRTLEVRVPPSSLSWIPQVGREP